MHSPSVVRRSRAQGGRGVENGAGAAEEDSLPQRTLRVPLACALPQGEPQLAMFVDTWIDLARRDGTLDALYAC